MISTADYKISNWRQIISVLVSSIGTAITISGCSANGFQSSTEQWKTYTNPRYGFEFPYPSNWTPITPDNNDGVAIVSTKNPQTEIRAWATKELPQLQTPEQNIQNQQIDQNFKTAQGLTGVMIVDTNQQISSIKLTILHRQTKYHWHAQTSNKDFKYTIPYLLI
jgi:hypothetical protein